MIASRYFWAIDNDYYHDTNDSVNNSGQHVVKYNGDYLETLSITNEELKFI